MAKGVILTADPLCEAGTLPKINALWAVEEQSLSSVGCSRGKGEFMGCCYSPVCRLGVGSEDGSTGRGLRG